MDQVPFLLYMDGVELTVGICFLMMVQVEEKEGPIVLLDLMCVGDC